MVSTSSKKWRRMILALIMIVSFVSGTAVPLNSYVSAEELLSAETPATLLSGGGGGGGGSTVPSGEPFLQWIELKTPYIDLGIAETSSIVLQAYYSDGSIVDITNQATFESLNPEVAAIGSNGIVTGLSLGRSRITVTYNGSLEGVVDVNINNINNTPPIYQRNFFHSEENRYVQLIFDRDIVPLNDIQADISYAVDGVNYVPLTQDDSVNIYGRQISIHLRSGELQAGSKIKIAANSLKDNEDHLLTSDVIAELQDIEPELSVEMFKVKEISSLKNGLGEIKIRTNDFGAWEQGELLKIKLPLGFRWQHPPTVNFLWGENLGCAGCAPNVNIIMDDDNRTLIIENRTLAENMYIVLDDCRVIFDDSVAKVGTVDAYITGPSSLTTNHLTVANYIDNVRKVPFTIDPYGTIPQVYSGKEATLGNIMISDPEIGSFQRDTRFRITLPEGMSWLTMSGDSYGAIRPDAMPRLQEVKNLRVSPIQFIDNRSAEFWIEEAYPNTKGKIVWSTGKVLLPGIFKGDLRVKVSGSSLEGSKEVTVAKANPAITVQNTVTEVKNGVQNQLVGDLLITESAPEMLDGDLNFTLPYGVTFDGVPKLERIQGDVDFDQPTLLYSERVRIFIKSTSTQPATLRLSNVKLRIDRTVPDGDIKLAIGQRDATTPKENPLTNVTIARVVSTTEPVAVTGIQLDPREYQVRVGSQQQLNVMATYQDRSIKNITNLVSYSSSNPVMAEVSSTGVVTGKAVGEVTITATYGNQTATALVRVNAPIVSSRQLGDVNGDNLINIQDIVATVSIVLGKKVATDDEAFAANMNNDGTLNIMDIVQVVNKVLGR